ncbi:MAG: hypothetical protein JST40_08215 [Armatimonadetes bacterium]|nr:hypothetical protein [Armatimonadota bacterium]
MVTSMWFHSLLVLGLTFGILGAAQSKEDQKPCDAKATPEAKALLSYLQNQQGKAFVSGQTDHPDALWVKEKTGRLPAILGLDFMRATRRDGGETENTKVAIEWTKAGGIVTFQWHWVSPTGAPDRGKGFYSKDNPYDFSVALANTKSDEYAALLEDIDDVAEQIGVMAKSNVPIIFRPLHEAQGAWFWWGTKGPENCKKLYRLVFERLTEHHKLHNILWAWTAYPASQQKGDPAAWYPGDQFVDFVVSDYCEKKQDYLDLVELTNGKKLVALAETMNAPDPSKVLAETPWAYWVTWAKRDWNDRSEGDLIKAMAEKRTVSRDQVRLSVKE